MTINNHGSSICCGFGSCVEVPSDLGTGGTMDNTKENNQQDNQPPSEEHKENNKVN